MSQSCVDNSFGPYIQGCRNDFDFTLLFEQSILSIAPSAVLLLLAVPRVGQLLRSSVKTDSDHFRYIKPVTAFTLVALHLVLLILWIGRPLTRVTVPAAALGLGAAVAVLILSFVEHSRAVRPSFLLNSYLVITILCDVVQARTLFLEHVGQPVEGLVTTIIAFKVILLVVEAKGKRSLLRQPYRDYPPEAISGIWGLSFLYWLNPLFIIGFKRLLSLGDLYHADQDLLSAILLTRVQKSWNQRKASRGAVLIRTCLHCLWRPLSMTLLPRLLMIAFTYAQPFLITRAINLVDKPKTPKSINEGYGLIAATGLIYLGIALSTVHYKHRLYRFITMFRGAVASLIYARTLELQDGVYEEASALTLMSSDIDTIITNLEQAVEFWAKVLTVCIGVWLLERQLGWPCVGPIVLVIICFGAAAQVAKLMGPALIKWLVSVQQRVARTASILSQMKSIKMMGMTTALETVIHDLRIREVDDRKRFRQLLVLLGAISFQPILWGPVVALAMYAIQAYVQGSDKLSTSQAFTSLALVTLVTSPAIELMNAIPSVPLAVGSFGRIEEFLLRQSFSDQRVTAGSSVVQINNISNGGEEIDLQELHAHSMFSDHALSACNLSIRPSADAPQALIRISFSIPRGSLAIITGPTGSGKSTLFRALLGELPYDTGSLSNGTVRQLVCGVDQSNDDHQWYRTVIHACALEEDIALMPNGDETVTGSRGHSLSGGQKQRLALARAVFARNDLLLLDDILSAVDAETDTKVMNRLFGTRGLLRIAETTVILATHDTRKSQFANQIILLNDKGQIETQGTYPVFNSSDETRLDSSVARCPPDMETNNEKDLQDSKEEPVLEIASLDDLADLTRQTGDLSVYKYYLKSIPTNLSIIMLLLTICSTFVDVFQQIWLKWYTDGTIKNLGVFIGVYAFLVVSSGVFLTGWQYVFLILATPRSGIYLHAILLRVVMHAPLSFFSSTDIGVTLNRFSQDMTLVDSALPAAASVTLLLVSNCLGSAALVCMGSTYMALSLPALLLTLFFVQKVYLKTSRQIRFLDLEAKSPLYTHFLETLEGLPTIRAFGWQSSFRQSFLEHLDASQKPYYLMYCIQRWLNLVLDLTVGVMAVLLVTLSLQLRVGTSAGSLGIALNAILSFNEGLSALLDQWTQLETSLGAIARLKTFETCILPEDKPGEDVKPFTKWPSHGAIAFHNVHASYSGKSTLLLSLLRLIEIDSGDITIDELDLAHLPRELIRSCILVVPQDALQLVGTVRFNLDPASSIEDTELVAALTKVGLWSVLDARGGLEADTNAQPLSHGQQQLFSLARAVLRKNTSPILLLDEATSSMDHEMDQIVHTVIKQEFVHHTVLTVAHRLNSIMESDRVVVMEAGKLIEIGRPVELLKKEHSAFGTLRRC